MDDLLNIPRGILEEGMLEANGSVKGMTALSVSDAFVTFPCRSALPALCESVRSQKEKKRMIFSASL